jgi:hypothetical protein
MTLYEIVHAATVTYTPSGRYASGEPVTVTDGDYWRSEQTPSRAEELAQSGAEFFQSPMRIIRATYDNRDERTGSEFYRSMSRALPSDNRGTIFHPKNS